ncbi:MAG: hypothetical protein H6704_05430 [Myxococcales bacterium]|nr:hypothetical protein [Myxococcales bacterium]
MSRARTDAALLAAAVAALGLAAWMALADWGGGPPTARAAQPERVAERPTPGRAVASRDDDDRPATGPLPPLERDRRRGPDRSLTALRGPDTTRFVMVDVRALKAAPFAPDLRACIEGEEKGDLDHLRAAGLDPLEQIDRVGGTDDVITLEGDFAGFDPTLLRERFVAEARPGGVTVYRNPRHDPDSDRGERFARVGDDLIVVGRTPSHLDAALDRLAGRAELGPPPVFQREGGAVQASVKASDLLDGVPVPYAARRLAEEALDALDLRAALRVQVGEGVDVRATLYGAAGTDFGPAADALGAVLEAMQQGPEHGPRGRGDALDAEHDFDPRRLFDQLSIQGAHNAIDIRLPVSGAVVQQLLRPCLEARRL